MMTISSLSDVTLRCIIVAFTALSCSDLCRFALYLPSTYDLE